MSHGRVLVADDDPEIRRMLFRFLHEQSGFDCLTVATGGEAILQCRRGSPDVVLLDIALDRITGFDVLRALHSDFRTRDIPVVLLTGQPNADLLESAGRWAQPFAFVRKPFDLEALRTILRNAILQRRKAGGNHDADMIVHGDLRIDLKQRRAFIKETSVKLGPQRFEILCTLARSPNGVPTAVLRDLHWPDGPHASNIVRITVRRLGLDLARISGRRMIGAIPSGYKLL